MGDFSGSLLDVVANNFLLELVAVGIPALGILSLAAASWRNPKKSADPSYFKKRRRE